MEQPVSDAQLLPALKDKVVVITGGNNGIGKACVDYYASGGANVVFGDLRNTCELASNVSFVQCNVTKWEEQLDLFETAYKKYGRIDTVIVNAGVGELSNIFKDEFDEQGKLKPPSLTVYDVNLVGATYTTKLAFSYFTKQPQGGDVVLIGSMASYEGETGLFAYSATKHALLGLMRATRKWTPTFNTRINLVGPYMTETGLMNDKLRAAFAGFPVQPAIAIARAAANFTVNTKYNGHGVIVGADKIFELEDKFHELRPQWMSSFMADLKDDGDSRVSWEAWLMS